MLSGTHKGCLHVAPAARASTWKHKISMTTEQDGSEKTNISHRMKIVACGCNYKHIKTQIGICSLLMI